MMQNRVRFLWVLAPLLWCVTVNAQYNPYEKQKKPGVRPAKVTPSATGEATAGKKKRRTVKKNQATQRPPELVQSITPETAFGDPAKTGVEAPLNDRIEAIEKALESMRQMLARAGIREDVGTMSLAEREEYGRLETKLQKVRADHKALILAIDRGLEPRLLAANLSALETQMAQIHQEMDRVRTSSDNNDVPLSKKLADSDARIAQLEKEVATLKAHDAATVEEKVEAADTRTPMEKLNALLPVEIFAFGDFMYVIEEDAPDDFAIGQLELDLTQDLIAPVTITAAIAYDSEAESIGVGAFTIDGRILGADETHLRMSKKIDSLGVILGQFDVPFGIDYLEYASIHRRLVTGPIAVDATLGGWNDLGAQMYLMMPHLNAVLYGVNGFGYETSETGPAGHEIVFGHSTSLALGGRLGLLPVEALEIGGSLASFFNSDAEATQLLAGADVTVNALDFIFKSEYIFQQQGLETNLNRSNHGMYGGAQYDFKPVFVSARYSMVWPDEGTNEKQLSLGTGVQVFENGEIRFEYSTNLESGGAMAFIQLAGGSAWQPSGMRR